MRTIAIRVDTGDASQLEEAFLKLVESNLFPVPGPLDPYFRGIGEFSLSNGKRTRVHLPEQGLHDFGRIGPDNHWLYAAYPLPRIAAL